MSKSAPLIIAAISLIASIVIARNWLLTGGGDIPSFVVWTAFCFFFGFAIAGLFCDNEFEKRFDKQLKENIATSDDIDMAMGRVLEKRLQPMGEEEIERIFNE